MKGPPPDIYVVDNHSGDDSLFRIQERLDALVEAKPKTYRLQSQDADPPSVQRPDSADERATVCLIPSDQNRGFGGGVNLGLRAALLDPSIQLFWILNNDTEIMPGALEALKNVFRRDASLGVLGSCLCYQTHPEIIQAVGGQYRPWLGTTRHVLGGRLYQEALREADRPDIDYAVGAAACIRREVLMEAGLFPEDYFLYFEDMDWAFSVRKKAPQWRIDFCLESVVLHQEGASTGANESEGKKTTLLADSYYQRNRLRFARRWYPGRYPLVHLTQLLVFLNRVKRRQWSLAVIALGLFFGWVPNRLKPQPKSD
jgi:GT2 family glycosyltransferase